MNKMRKLRSQKQDWRHLMIISFMFYGIISGNNEALVHKTEVLVNDMVSIHCYTNASVYIQWHFNSIFNYVFAGGKLWYPYKERLRTEDDNAGSHILIIPRVRGEDAGWYYCSEEEAPGRRISSTHLTVLFSNPGCHSNMDSDGFIGPNTCNLEQENMVFNCIFSFNGSFPPHLVWRLLNANRTLNSSICENKTNRRNCSLILKSDPIYDGSIFICQTTASADSSFNCSTEVIKILYLSATNDTAKKYVNDNINCSAKSNLDVKYNWTLHQSNKVSFLSSKQNILIQKPGIYQCEVNYSIRNYSCITLASVVNASVEITKDETISGSTTVAIIPSIVLGLLVISIGIVLLIRTLRKRKREKKRREYERGEYELREYDRRENEIRENERIRNKIEDMQDDFVSNVDPQDVLEPLISGHAISEECRDVVLKKATTEDRCRALLGHLSASSNTASFIVLKKALDIYYPWIAEQIGANDDKPVKTIPENEKIKDKVISMYIDFTREVDPKNIFDLLIRTKIFNLEEQRELMNKDTGKERCRVLIDHLFRCPKENAFIILRAALKRCYPKIVERIDAPDADNEADDITITDKEENERIRNRVVNIYEEFVSEVDPEKVLDFLIQNKIVNIKQKHYLKKQATTHDQCKALIDLLVSSSKDNVFVILKEALKEHYSGIVERIDFLTIDDEYQKNSDKKSTMRLESSIVVFGRRDVLKISLNRPNEVSAPQQLPFEVRSFVAAAVYCGSVFVTGIGKYFDEIWRFVARNSRWNKCASLIKGRYCPSVAFVDHILYICGACDDVGAYDAIDDKYSFVGKLTYAVCYAINCVPYKASLYIFGGVNAHRDVVKIVQVYNTKFNTCTILTNPMPICSKYLRAALFQNYVILLEGKSCLLLNFDTETWEVRDQFKTCVNYFGMAVHNEKLFVIGGEDSNDDRRDDVRYVPIENILNDEPIEWQHHAKLPKPYEVWAFGKLEFLVKQI